MRRTNPDSLKSCLCFQVFRLYFLLTLLAGLVDTNSTKSSMMADPLSTAHGVRSIAATESTLGSTTSIMPTGKIFLVLNYLQNSYVKLSTQLMA